MKEARHIVKRIHSRRLYKCFESAQQTETGEDLKEKLAEALNQLGPGLNIHHEDIVFYEYNKDYGNPSDCITFYDKPGNILTKDQMKKKYPELSGPNTYRAQCSYIFCKPDINLDMAAAKKAVEGVLQQHAAVKTPSKLTQTGA